jgi:hypothetical protein
MEDNSGARFIRESARAYLHELKGFVARLKNIPADKRLGYTREECRRLNKYPLLLQYLRNDMPTEELFREYHIFIAEGIQLASCLNQLREDLKKNPSEETRTVLADIFCEHVQEILDRASLRYHRLHEGLQRVLAQNPA